MTTYFLIALTGLITLIASYCLRRAFYWHNRYVSSGISLELHLATQQQIINELKNRPNVHLVMLESEEDDEDNLVVTTHAWNMTPEIILASLKIAYDAMVEHTGLEQAEEEESEEEESEEEESEEEESEEEESEEEE